MISKKATRLSRRDASRVGPACRTASTTCRNFVKGPIGPSKIWALASRFAALLPAASVTLSFAGTSLSGANVTFYRDVLPILQAHCQGCHRAGEMAPMPFESYEQTQPFATAIRDATSKRTMPPWFADPCCGHFSNDPSLSDGQIKTLANWADEGAPEGKAEGAAPQVKRTAGWNIESPDL